MITVGSAPINTIYVGSQEAKAAYYGSTKVWESKLPSGTVILDTSANGTHNVVITKTQEFEIWMVGGGSGAAGFSRMEGMGQMVYVAVTGASGGYIHGIITIEAGEYTAKVGAGSAHRNDYYTVAAGGATTFLGQSAGGGGAHSDTYSCAGGSCTITLSGLTGVNGNGGFMQRKSYGEGGASVYGGYGKGGSVQYSGTVEDGGSGYIKIVAV